MLFFMEFIKSTVTGGLVILFFIKFLHDSSFLKIFEHLGSSCTCCKSSALSVSPKALSKKRLTRFWISFTLRFPIFCFVR